MKKHYSSKVLLVILLFSFQYSFAAETRVVKVGAFNNFPVIFQYTDGVFKGLYVDLLTEIGQKENIRFEYIQGTWKDGLDRIRSGEVDLLTSVGYTEERSIFMDYCRNPLLTVWGELYVIKSSDIKGILDIGSTKGPPRSITTICGRWLAHRGTVISPSRSENYIAFGLHLKHARQNHQI